MTMSVPSGARAWLPIAADCIVAIAIAASAFGAMASRANSILVESRGIPNRCEA